MLIKKAIASVIGLSLVSLSVQPAAATLYTIPGTKQQVDITSDGILTDDQVQAVLVDISRYTPNLYKQLKFVQLKTGTQFSSATNDGIILGVAGATPDFYVNRFDSVMPDHIYAGELSTDQRNEY